jgi:hypothetical protein
MTSTVEARYNERNKQTNESGRGRVAFPYTIKRVFFLGADCMRLAFYPRCLSFGRGGGGWLVGW